jgi:hypothetical protein
MFKSKPITNGCVNANEQKKQKRLHCMARKKRKKRKEHGFTKQHGVDNTYW